MNIEPLKAARAELADTLASLDKVIAFYESGQRLVTTAVGRAHVPLSVEALRKMAPPAEARKVKAPKMPARVRAGGRGETTELFRAVVDSIEEPFTVASSKTAFLIAHPQKQEWAINISGVLHRWSADGLLERTAGGGTGNPSSYRRTKRWGTVDGPRTEKERAYMDFRSTIATPKTEEE